ncbi:MAG TPA: triose-phosphate isomerase [Thermoanaerobaculia bacterium]|nr:triose-phosphate isomerase [Thermoanaerobaculia bacterium]
MRSRYAIANWKMNLPPEGIETYTRRLRVPPGIRVVIAPPFPYLPGLARNATLAGQNCADQPSGAYTGEVSAAMLRDCGAEFVIIGHSERRKLYGETDERVARKLRLALESGLTPILCVGEDQAVRDGGGAASFVAAQLERAAPGGRADVVVAYEPIWAIGTGRNATGMLVAEMVGEIRLALRRFWPAGSEERTPVLYGGSVTPDNIEELGQNGRMDGYLVGGASLDSSKFSTICEGVARPAPI